MGDWMPEPDGLLQRRFVELHLTLDEVLKGRPAEICGESVTICVEQRGTGGRRVSDDYGVWSRVNMEQGQRLVAFCAAPSADMGMAALLAPPICEHLADASVLPDLWTCVSLEARRLSADELLARAAPLLESRTGILARYVWARVRAVAFADVTVFEALTHIVERPQTAPEPRAVLVAAIHEELALLENLPRPAAARFAQALLRILTVTEAAPLHENVAQVYLPNLLGLAQGDVVLSVADVLGGSAPTTSRVRAILEAHPGLDPDGQLRRWLELHAGGNR